MGIGRYSNKHQEKQKVVSYNIAQRCNGCRSCQVQSLCNPVATPQKTVQTYVLRSEKCMSFRYNTKKLWGIINDISAKQNDKSSLIDCLRISNVLEYDANKIANKFGEYFASVGKSYSDKVAKPVHDWKYYCDKIERNARTLFMNPCTELELQKLIKNLPSKNKQWPR